MATLFMTSLEATGWVRELSTPPPPDPPHDSIPISTSDNSLLEFIDYLSLAVIKYAIHRLSKKSNYSQI